MEKLNQEEEEEEKERTTTMILISVANAKEEKGKHSFCFLMVAHTRDHCTFPLRHHFSLVYR